MKFLYALLIILGGLFSIESVIGQNLTMVNGNFTRCNGTLFDPGGNANYASLQSVTTTICPGTSGAQVRLSFTTFVTENNIDELEIYEGVGTGGTLIGTFSGGLAPFDVQSSDPSGCLTLVFNSDGSIEDIGFEATMSCFFPCQQVVSSLVSSTPVESNGLIDVCLGQTLTLSGTGTYPSTNPLYGQSNATSSFQWDMGDGNFVNGQNATYTYQQPGVYDLDLNITDSNGCDNTNDINVLVRVSAIPTFIGTNVANTDICLGETNTLQGFAQDQEVEYYCVQELPDTTFIPDGIGVPYTTSITLDCFAAGATIAVASDIQNICLDIEHSYIHDLDIEITCPNGQTTDLYIPAGLIGTNSVYLGEPVDDDNSMTLGTPYNYCFSMSGTQTWYDVAEPTPPPPLGTIPTYNYTDNDGTAITNQYYVPSGTYLPTGDFADLIGCPMNGDWTITVTDGLTQDNGTVFNWSMDFNPNLYNTADNFTPTLTDTMWLADPTITSTTNNEIVVTPTQAGQACYTFRATDAFNCDYDTTICFNVAPLEDASFSYVQAAYCTNEPNPTPTITGLAGGTFTSQAGLSINPSTGEIDVLASTPGSYTVDYTTIGSGCQSVETQAVDINVAPTATMSGDATLCEGQTATASVALTGTSPWDFTYSDGTNNQTITGITTSPYTFNTNTSGNFTLVSVSNAACQGSTSGSATVVFNQAVSYSNVTASCDAGNNNYVVTFELSGGDNTTYSVTGMTGGTITNPTPGVYLFTSNNIPAGTTNYSFSFSDANGCNTETIAGTQNCGCPATAVLSGGGAICSGDSVQLTVNLTGTAPFNFSVTDGTTTTPYVSAANTFNFFVQNTGTYTLTSMSDATCTGSASGNANVTAQANPTVAVQDQTICEGETVGLTANPSVVGGTYTWTPAPLPSTQTIQVSPAATQYYYVEYDLNGCTAIDSALVTVNPSAAVSVNDDAVCNGGSATLTATPVNAGGTYSWTPGNFGNVNSITVSPTQTTSYTVTYDLNGCTESATGTVTVGSQPTMTMSDTTICSGSVATIYATVSPAGGVFNWQSPPAPAGTNTASFTDSPTQTTYYPLVYDFGGCIVEDSALVTVNFTPTVTVNDNAVCNGNAATLTGMVDAPGGFYEWSPGPLPNTQTVSVSPTTNTTYQLIYSLGNCADTTTALVSVISAPTLTVNDETICEGDSVLLTAQGSPNGGTYTWDDQGQTTQSIYVGPTTTTSYNVVYDINGCSSNAAGVVTVNPPLAVDATSNSAVCPGGTLNLNVSPNGGTYSWTGPQGFTSNTQAPTIPNMDATRAGWYYVEVTLNGCSNIDSVEVLVTDLEADFTADIQTGCEPLEVTFTNTSNNSVNCVWTFGDNNVHNVCGPVTHTYLSGGTYSVGLTISDASGACSDQIIQTDFIVVESAPEVSFSAVPSQMPQFDQVSTMSNQTTGANGYLWIFPNGQTSSQTNPTTTFNLEPGTDGQIMLIATSPMGCVDSATVSISVLPDVIYYVPNSFTPNGDLFNNEFMPIMSQGMDLKSYTFKIFDRWGGMIFQSNDAEVGWDGTYMNRICQDGVYTYVIEFIETENDRRHKVSGQVTLVR